MDQVVFCRAELRHPSCATLGTCILRFADFFGKIQIMVIALENHLLSYNYILGYMVKFLAYVRLSQILLLKYMKSLH